jgi:hypothetical protein
MVYVLRNSLGPHGHHNLEHPVLKRQTSDRAAWLPYDDAPPVSINLRSCYHSRLQKSIPASEKLTTRVMAAAVISTSPVRKNRDYGAFHVAGRPRTTPSEDHPHPIIFMLLVSPCRRRTKASDRCGRFHRAVAHRRLRSPARGASRRGRPHRLNRHCRLQRRCRSARQGHRTRPIA